MVFNVNLPEASHHTTTALVQLKQLYYWPTQKQTFKSSRLEASSVLAVLNFKFTSDHSSGNGSLPNSDRGRLSGDAARLNFTGCQYRGNAAALNQS